MFRGTSRLRHTAHAGSIQQARVLSSTVALAVVDTRRKEREPCSSK
jgi:hypothetical protein